jgi:hypothetical protein
MALSDEMFEYALGWLRVHGPAVLAEDDDIDSPAHLDSLRFDLDRSAREHFGVLDLPTFEELHALGEETARKTITERVTDPRNVMLFNALELALDTKYPVLIERCAACDQDLAVASEIAKVRGTNPFLEHHLMISPSAMKN